MIPVIYYSRNESSIVRNKIAETIVSTLGTSIRLLSKKSCSSACPVALDNHCAM